MRKVRPANLVFVSNGASEMGAQEQVERRTMVVKLAVKLDGNLQSKVNSEFNFRLSLF